MVAGFAVHAPAGRLAWRLAGCVAEDQCHYDDDVEGADGRQEIGIRSIGEITKSAEKPTAILARRGTRGSARSNRAVITQAGRNPVQLLEGAIR